MKDLKNIDQAFKQLQQESSPAMLEDIQWSAIETGIKRKEFYSFSFFRFNVFYAAAFILNLLISTFILLDYFNKEKVVQSNNSAIIENKGTKQETLHTTIADTAGFDKNTLIRKNTVKSPTYSKPLSENHKENQEKLLDLDNNTPNSIAIEATPIDTVSIDYNINKEKEKIKKAPTSTPIPNPDTVYIYKRDTIIRLDSIKVSPKKLRKLKQN